MKNISPGSLVPGHARDRHFQYVAGLLDKEPPWALRWLIPLLSSRVTIDHYIVERLRELARLGPVVYAMKYRSIYDLHFLRMRFADLGLPVPSFVFGMSPSETGSIVNWMKSLRGWAARLLRSQTASTPVEAHVLTEVFDRGGAGVLFLVDEKTSRTRYVQPESDPLRILLDLQGRLGASIAVVPLFILYDRTQRRTIRPFWESFLGDPDRPGPLKRLLIATRKWTVPELLIGEPVYLVGEFEEFGSERSWEELPFEVRKDLIDAMNARIRVNRGPERLSRTEIKERVLQDERLQRAVRRAVARDPDAESKIRKKVESFVDEMAGDQRIQVHHFLYHFLKWLFSKIFDGIDLKESQFPALKTKNQEGSLIYVSCHKSHLDYLLVGYLSFVNQMAIPYMAAGKNLSFWPVGPLLRNAGAFFIRRSFKGLGLYPHVFAAYLKVLVKENVNINFYIEGGRSRTGKLLPPRLGMLSFLLQSVKEGSISDLTFVPTFVGYDQVPEESSFLRELAGREKQKESVFAVLRSREILRKRFGKAYIRFHEPVSYRAFCERYYGRDDNDRSSSEESRKLLYDFAYHLMQGIVKAGVVTPIDLTAAGLVCANRNSVTHRFLLEATRCLYHVLGHERIECVLRSDEIESAVKSALGLFGVRGLIEIQAQEPDFLDTVYLINEQKRVSLQFYKNSLVNYLWPACLLATVILKHGHGVEEISPELRQDFILLKRILSSELIWDPLITDDDLLKRTFTLFSEQGWTRASGEEGTDLENRTVLECLRGVIFDMLVQYYVVLSATDTAADGPFSQKEFARRTAKTCQDLFPAEDGIPAPTLPLVTTANALARFSEMGIVEYVPARKILNGVIDVLQRDQVREFLAASLGVSVKRERQE